ncbi:hypothetical protein CFAM422_010435 [Trichoderma lentiforme]|uniref:Uncharacterized protein n=1 Tax=Trichoderma lentiforme TaxID=1567552 RepID=A0A9P4X852_9HYPO|nr:hypothetical protein CFAM422_010435 [Trichoderma lentiforme]
MYSSRLKGAGLDNFLQKTCLCQHTNISRTSQWCGQLSLPPTVSGCLEMWAMMVISMLNYHVDEYMESHRSFGSTDLLAIGHGLATHLSLHSDTSQRTVSSPPSSDYNSPRSSPAFEDLEKSLLVHTAHNGESASMMEIGHRSPGDQVPDHDWVRTTGANNTSCPSSAALTDWLRWSRGILQERCARILPHFAASTNDYDSMRRDDAEDNLSGLHFHEFTGGNEQSLSFQLTAENGRRDFS